MAITNYLPAGSDAATSAVIAVGAGQALTLVGAARAGGDAYWRVQVQRLMSDGAWETMGAMSWERPLLTIYGEGSWRLLREAGAGCLVDGALA